MDRTSKKGVEITRGTLHDREAVREVCEACYEDDYILRMGDAFLSTGTVLLARAEEEEPVGLVRLTVAMDGSSWLSALRVVPSRRRKGIGGVLCRACEDVARENRSTVIRLWTEETNEAAYSLFRELSYRTVRVFTRWWTSEMADLPVPEPARDIHEAWRRVLEADVYQASAGYTPLSLRFCRMSEPLLAELADAGRLFLDSSGAPCVLDSHVWGSFGQKMVEVTVLGDDIAAQLRAAGAFAPSDYVGVGTFLPADDPWPDLAERAGLQQGSWGNRAVLCEKSIV